MKEKLKKKYYLHGHESEQYKFIKGTWISESYYFEKVFELVESEFNKFFRKVYSNSKSKKEIELILIDLLSHFALTVWNRINSEPIYLSYLEKKYNPDFDEISETTFKSLIKEELLLGNVVLLSLLSKSKELQKILQSPFLKGRQIKEEDLKLYIEVYKEYLSLKDQGKTGHQAAMKQAARNILIRNKEIDSNKKDKRLAENTTKNLPKIKSIMGKSTKSINE
jgi:hypothetical protein